MLHPIAIVGAEVSSYAPAAECMVARAECYGYVVELAAAWAQEGIGFEVFDLVVQGW